MRAWLSWLRPLNPPGGTEWRAYATTSEDTKGELVGTCPIGERTIEVERPEGWWYFRVVPAFGDGSEDSWRDAEVLKRYFSGVDGDVPEPPSVAIGQVDPLEVRVMADPPDLRADDHRLEIIELPPAGTIPELGIVKGHVEFLAGGPMAPNFPRQPSAPLTVEGAGGSTPTTRRLAVRGVNPHGLVSPEVLRDVAAPVRPHHHRIELASIIGTARVGIDAPTGADGWELDATEGLRLRAIPAVQDLDDDWGHVDEWGEGDPVASGRNRWLAPYVDTVVVVMAADHDFGTPTHFVLESYVQGGRSETDGGIGAQEDHDVASWNSPIVDPSFPEARGEGRIGAELEGPGGLFRSTRVDGLPVEPLRLDHLRTQYILGDTGPLDDSEGEWKDALPGLVLYGQFVRVRLKITEPTGLFQVAIPKWVVSAHVPQGFTSSGSAPSADVPPVSFHVDTTAKRLYFSAGTALAVPDWQAVPVATAASVRGANVDALPPSARTGDRLEATANGDLNAAGVFDGLTLSVGDEVFLKANIAPDSGPYVIGSLGSAGTHWYADRRAAEAGGVVLPADRSYLVREGDTMRGHAVVNVDAITVNTTSWAPVIPRGVRLRRTHLEASGTYTWKPHLYARIASYVLQGAGGGGHYAASTGANGAVGGGGAAGATVRGMCLVLDPSITVHVGAKGAAGVAATATAPTAGGQTDFVSAASTRTAKGGGVGATRAGTGTGVAAGGTPTAGSTAEGGADDVLLDSGRDGAFGLQLTIANVMGGRGAASELGGGGLGGPLAGGAGDAATGHGAGGGGGSAPAGGGGTNSNGGDGSDGDAEFVEIS